MAGSLLHNGLDLVVLAVKPQVAVWVVAARLKRAGVNWWRYLLPLAMTVILSFLLWPGWPIHIWTQFRGLQGTWWNVAPWPWGAPVGLWLLWRAWRTGRNEWGILATPLLFPFANFQTT